MLTGADTPEAAAEELGRLDRDRRHHASTPQRASRSPAASAVEVPDFEPGPVVDTTGDRDLLCAAFAWADLRGAQPR